MRKSSIERNTNETKIKLFFNLDGKGAHRMDTGCGFLNHMLELFARHGGFDLFVDCKGDTHVDDHHSVEDIGICLGRAFAESLGDKAGISRYGNFFLPMDETLVLCAVDLSGRGYLRWNVDFPSPTVGSFDTELIKEFWLAFSRESRATVHIRELSGGNTHHMAEAVFKGMGRALKEAAAVIPGHEGDIPSTKGVL